MAKMYISDKFYTYKKNGRTTGIKRVSRNRADYVDEFGDHHSIETVDVGYKDKVSPITTTFKLILCTVFVSLFLYGSYNINQGAYFGAYENYNNFDASNYVLDNGKTIKQEFNSHMTPVYDLDGNLIPYEYNYLSNDFDWFNKFKVLEDLRNPFYDGLLPTIISDSFNNPSVVPTTKILNDFITTNYTIKDVFRITIPHYIDTGVMKLEYFSNIGYWQIVNVSYDFKSTRERIIFNNLNDDITKDSLTFWDYAKGAVIFPVNLIYNIFDDVAIFIRFIKEW